ncbi:serine threonine-protein kinase nek9 [Ophiostoma piceae UAMH 11346]|uniref:Serine threonine-protein kinase nek9 n=1 Tax=Ophiostoma piceae (strain UAMH 11346) TaxID=1262450 RepID=S3CJ61_OPHP1|nr:serine threonine-protein kinase nek9 [Ophiostoma piceae UAMH 11346]
MKLYAAGFNAWGQLSFDQPADADMGEPDDIHGFSLILEDARIDVVTSRGDLVAGVIASDAARMSGADCLSCSALNGRVVVYDAKEGIIRQYASAQQPSASGHGQSEEFSFELPGIVQLVAYDVGFAALTSQGKVWVWGDGRFPECLGRGVEDVVAERPGLVAALEDLPSGPITKIAAGGYAFAAVTRGQDMYCWGRYLGRQQHRPVLEELAGEPEPVVVTQGQGDGQQELDVADVGVGEAHMIVLATDGRVYVVGSNANGQLGLGKGVESTAPSSWTKIDGISADGQRVAGVYAGPRSSFIVIDS